MKKPPERPPAPGLHHDHVPYDDEVGEDTLRAALEDLRRPPPPVGYRTSAAEGDSVRKVLAALVGEKVERMEAKRRSDNPTPLETTKKFLEHAKWFVLFVGGIVASGWGAKAYVDTFQTRDDAAAQRAAEEAAHADINDTLESQDEALDDLRVYNVRIDIQQRNADDRLDTLLELQAANSPSERREAREQYEETRERVEKRRRILHNPRALMQLVDDVERDPLVGLNGL